MWRRRRVPETAAGTTSVTGITGRRAGIPAKMFAVMAMTSLATFTALAAVYQTFFERQLFA
jgi:hypothetical protein